MGTACRRLGLLSLGVATLLLSICGVAGAHVTVQPGTAAVGSETTFTFRVPTEKARASTVKIVLALPRSPAIPAVSLQRPAGWDASVRTRKLPQPVQTHDGGVDTAVSRITWVPAGPADAIRPGEFQQFTIEAGPLPKTPLLMFKVLQYYSDGTVVRWIDPPLHGGAEAEHPAPVVTLRTGPTPSAAANEAGDPSSTGGVDGWIAVGGFVAGLLGLAAGTAALVVARRPGNRAPHERA